MISTDTAESPSLQWSGLQSLLEHAESDALILLDCCAAASSISGAGSGVTEVIAACGFETWAPGVGEHSFTRSLIDELRYWGQGNPLSVAMLHNKVLSRIKYWKPRFGKYGADNEQRKTPIYVVIADEGKQRSIVLTPLSPAESPAVELDAAPISASSASDASMGSQESDHDIAQDSSQSSLDQIWPDIEFRNPKVLISIALEEDQWLSSTHWVEWLRSVPALAKYAHVEGVYKSGSTLMLLSIPVAIWDLLPRNAATMFIGFTHSTNLLRSNPMKWNISWSKNAKSTAARSRALDLKAEPLVGDADTQLLKNPGLHQEEKNNQMWLNDRSIEEWMERLEPDIRDTDAPPYTPRDRTRQRPHNQAEPLSFAAVEQLNMTEHPNAIFEQAECHIPGPGVLIDEDSDDDEESVPDDVASIEDSPPPTTARGQLNDDLRGEARPGIYDELPSQPLLYRARLWQDPLHDSSDPRVKLQPESANAAMWRYAQRAGDIETASRAATWGSRCESESDLYDTLHLFEPGGYPYRQGKEEFSERLHRKYSSRTTDKELQRPDKPIHLKEEPTSPPALWYTGKDGNASRRESSSVAPAPSPGFGIDASLTGSPKSYQVAHFEPWNPYSDSTGNFGMESRHSFKPTSLAIVPSLHALPTPDEDLAPPPEENIIIVRHDKRKRLRSASSWY